WQRAGACAFSVQLGWEPAGNIAAGATKTSTPQRLLSEPRPTLERGPLGKDNARCSASEPAFDIRGSTPAATMLSSTSFSSCFLLLLAAQVVTMRFGAIAT